jgi:hypothetical protein
MHINSLLHWRNLLVDPPNVQERLYITSTQDSGESFAECGKACYASPHLHRKSELEGVSKYWQVTTHLAYTDKDVGNRTIESIG